MMGEKRRKVVDCPSPSRDLIPSSSDDAMHEELVFSAEDDISHEELSRCREELWSRQQLVYVDHVRKIRGEAKEHLYQHLSDLRLRDYKILKDRGDLVDITDSAPIWEFEDASEPGPSMFGWTIDYQYYHLSELTDYQRIVPMRTNIGEYRDWEEYRTSFSKYDTDVEYVKYCDELSKKIKWIEVYLPEKYQQVHQSYKDRGARQAMKIAAGFSHLPLSLATRGYEEYLWDLRYELELKDYIHAFFEVWKRMIKQKMSFEDALKHTLSENVFYYPSRIEAKIEGCGPPYHDIKGYMDVAPLDVVKDNEAMKLITELVNHEAQRTKIYLDYVKKKLEVAQRIRLTGACALK